MLTIATFLPYPPSLLVAPSKDSTNSSLREEETEAESEGVSGNPDYVSLQGISDTAAGMFCISLSCDTTMYIQMSQRS